MYYSLLAEHMANDLSRCGISSGDIEIIKKLVPSEIVHETIEFMKMIEDYEEEEG